MADHDHDEHHHEHGHGHEEEEEEQVIHPRHPLQRLQAPGKDVSLAIHSMGLVTFYFAFRFLLDNPNEISNSYGWHLQYLTIIGLALTTATFLLGLLADIENVMYMFHAKNFLSVISTPLEVLIAMLYWGLRSIDPALVLDPRLPPLPFLADLRFHLFPALFLLADVLLLSPPWTVSLLGACFTGSALAIGYWVWIEICYTQNGFYPYPLFALLDTPQRIALFGGAALAMVLNTLALKALYGYVNGVQPKDTGLTATKEFKQAEEKVKGVVTRAKAKLEESDVDTEPEVNNSGTGSGSVRSSGRSTRRRKA